MSGIETTYRLVILDGHDTGLFGRTALTAELAKLVPGDINESIRKLQRLGLERTDWVDHFGKPKIVRTVLIEAESKPGEWELGVVARPIEMQVTRRRG